MAVTSLENLERLLEINRIEGIRQIIPTAEVIGKGKYTKDGTFASAVYHAVEKIYPRLSREQRDEALKQVLSIIDKVTYNHVQNYIVSYIREPLFFVDISIARPLYWPGLDEGKRISQQYTTFSELQKEIINENGLFKPEKVDSDFIVGYSLLRSDFSNFGEEYVKAVNSEFLNRVMKGIVARRFAPTRNYILTREDIEKGRQRLQELLPKSLHNRIEQIRKETDWVDWTKIK